MNVVERRDALVWHAVRLAELELAEQAPYLSCAGRNDDGADAVGDRIAGEHEYRANPARRLGPQISPLTTAGCRSTPRSHR